MYFTKDILDIKRNSTNLLMKCINKRCIRFAPKRDTRTGYYREQILCDKCVELTLDNRLRILLDWEKSK